MADACLATGDTSAEAIFTDSNLLVNKCVREIIWSSCHCTNEDRDVVSFRDGRQICP